MDVFCSLSSVDFVRRRRLSSLAPSHPPTHPPTHPPQALHSRPSTLCPGPFSFFHPPTPLSSLHCTDPHTASREEGGDRGDRGGSEGA